jgi:uncharacterized protein YodC (DUF2158 family)
MTIYGEESVSGKVCCQWFVENELKLEYFLIETLVKIDNNPSGI